MRIFDLIRGGITLFKRSQIKDNVLYWGIINSPYENELLIYYGTLHNENEELRYNNVIKHSIINNINKHIDTLVNKKKRSGYKEIEEITDQGNKPVEGRLMYFLKTYLPVVHTDEKGELLPMLAKVYDNENNKLFSKGQSYGGQAKINGLRAMMTIEQTDDLFNPYKVVFRGREGSIYDKCEYLGQRIIKELGEEVINTIIENELILDGELYIPGLPVNEINSAVKNEQNPNNKRLQYWNYDLINKNDLEELFIYRDGYRTDLFIKFVLLRYHNDYPIGIDHLEIDSPFVCLDTLPVENDISAVMLRNLFIKNRFEGLVIKNNLSSYQFGKRNSAMWKYKDYTDGIFEIVDIIPEGEKRPDIPKFVCKNDINEFTFECKLSGTIEYQKTQFNKENIGRKLLVEYVERSGVNQVPFHIKQVRFVE